MFNDTEKEIRDLLKKMVETGQTTHEKLAELVKFQADELDNKKMSELREKCLASQKFANELYNKDKELFRKVMKDK